MDERVKFVLRLAEGEKMTDLCREFGVSRKTGYKIFNRYKSDQFEGLLDRKSGPRRPANRTSSFIENIVFKTKLERPTWGARKLHEYLLKKYPDVNIPAKNTIHNILLRNDLVKKRNKRRRFSATPTHLSTPENPNDLWCMDFKGQFKLKNKNYCFPLTITDQVSRKILACEALDRISSEETILIFKEVLKEFGVPLAIRSDNGEPFSSRGLWSLSKLSVLCLKLGINIERIRPGRPQENGRHERMHRTLKSEATIPPGENLLQQQDKFDRFVQDFNEERPHEGLMMKTPNMVYKRSDKKYVEPEEIEYVDMDLCRQVRKSGSIYFNDRKEVYISKILENENVGLQQVEEDLWEVYFLNYMIGTVDTDIKRLSVAERPF